MATTTLFTAAAGFEAACRVDALPEGHRARRLHGHSFLAKLRCALPEGWADFPGGEVAKLRAALEAAVAPLDYALLNEQLPVPTDENLARWLRERLGSLPGIDQIRLQRTLQSGGDRGADSDSPG